MAALFFIKPAIAKMNCCLEVSYRCLFVRLFIQIIHLKKKHRTFYKTSCRNSVSACWVWI